MKDHVSHSLTTTAKIRGHIVLDKPVMGCCEHSNEPAGFMVGGKYLDRLSDY
jgi:hypothetical protein